MPRRRLLTLALACFLAAGLGGLAEGGGLGLVQAAFNSRFGGQVRAGTAATGQALVRQADGGWAGAAPAGAAHNLLSATHGDTTAAAVLRGDLVTGQGVVATWTRLPLGGSGAVLSSDGTDVVWGSLAAAGGWTDDGALVRLTTATDTVAGGPASAAPAAFTIRGTAGTGAGVEGGLLRLAGGPSGDAVTVGGDLRLGVAVVGSATAITDVLFVRGAGPGGRVGIGYSPGAFALDVNGSAHATSFVAGSSTTLATDTLTASGALTVTAAVGGLDLATTDGSSILFKTNNAYRWNLTSAGHLVTVGNNALDLGNPTGSAPRSGFFGTSVVVATTTTLGNGTLTGTAALALRSASGEPISFEAGGAGQWRVDPSGDLTADTDNADDIGASGANRPRTAYFGTSIVVGDTITMTGSQLTATANLTISSGASSNLFVQTGAGSGGRAVFWAQGSGAVELWTGSTQRLTISNAGGVAIGDQVVSTAGQLQWDTGFSFTAAAPEILGPSDTGLFISSPANRAITLTTTAGSGAAAGAITMTAGNSPTGFVGGALAFNAGGGGNAGGGIAMTSGNAGGGGGVGGAWTATAGNPSGANAAGDATMNGGSGTTLAASTARPGGVFLNAGAAISGTNSPGGLVTIKTTTGQGTGVAGYVLFNENTTEVARLTTGKLTNYASIATDGWGVAAVYEVGRLTDQTAAVAAVTTFTSSAADGSYEVSANVLVTSSTTHDFTITCAYTDESNVARTVTLPFTRLTGARVNNITDATGAGPYHGEPIHLRVKASTTIVIATTGTFTNVNYHVEAAIKRTS